MGAFPSLNPFRDENVSAIEIDPKLANANMEIEFEPICLVSIWISSLYAESEQVSKEWWSW